MKKRVFIIHGWDGFPEEGWFPWLKSELEKKGFAVTVPAMPHPEEPTIKDWVDTVVKAVGTPDEQTYFVGHSMGCQTILRYVAGLPEGSSVGGLVLVAGFFTLTGFETEDVKEVARPWLETFIDTEKVKKISNGKIAALFSPTDKFVPLENKKLFEERLTSQTYIQDGVGVFGHFSGGDGVTELPKVLELMLAMSGPKTISIDEFSKMEIKMGKILSAEKIPGADKLYKLQVDMGSGEVRTICSGVAQFYQPEELVGKVVPVIANLKARMMRGVESCGMILMADDGGPVLLTPIRDVVPGSNVK